MNKNKIGFIGLSHLGIIYSLSAADKGFKVYAYDNNSKIISNLNRGINIIKEPKVEKNLKTSLKNKNIIFTDNIDELKNCNIVFISSDVETNKKGESNLYKINNSISKIKKCFDLKKILIILSQIPPEYIDKIKYPKEKLYYQVETLIFGQALKRANKPERIIIGMYNEFKKVNPYYLDYLNSYDAPKLFMNYKSAELTKIAINMFLISSVSMTNYLSKICEKSGANWFSIKKALQLDKRIGKNAYLDPGLGLSGGNLERDLRTLSNYSNKLKLNDNLLKSYYSISNQNKTWVQDLVEKILIKNNFKLNISLLGISYKENTNSLKNSPSIELVKKFKKIDFKYFDSLVIKTKYKNLKKLNTINAVISNSNLLIIFNRSNEFKKINLKILSNMKKRRIIIDPFGVLKHLDLKKINAKYYRMGIKNN
tara:strand:- start:2297 stop:3571 length:1275 start_codon:yes stop_codon:yes gene_type:complete